METENILNILNILIYGDSLIPIGNPILVHF